ETSPVTLLLQHDPRVVTDAAARKRLQDETLQDVAHSLGVETARLEVVGMHNADDREAGGVYVDLHILAEVRGQAGTSRQLAGELVAQGADTSSTLRGTNTGMRVVSVSHRREVEFVQMLRRTVQLLQDDLDSLQAHDRRMTGERNDFSVELVADRRMTGERNDFSVELVAVQQSVNQLQDELSHRDRTVTELERKLRDLGQELAGEKERAARAEAEAMNERVRVERLQAELQA
ncbi:hypothetical protein T484DRAFT_1827384, partial [Baffinella frigidus]